MMTVVRLKDVSKTYEKGSASEVTALKHACISVYDGEMIAIIGPSGSGKTTLLNIVGCLDEPTSGEYYFCNSPVEKMSQNELARIRNEQIGFVLQDFGLVEYSSAIENVKMPLFFGKARWRDMDRLAKNALEAVGMGEYAEKKVNKLSGGQKQRVAIARAIVNSPVLILADEPTAALDSATAMEIIMLFDEMRKNGKTVIIVTHDKKVAERCDKQFVLSDGVFC